MVKRTGIVPQDLRGYRPRKGGEFASALIALVEAAKELEAEVSNCPNTAALRKAELEFADSFSRLFQTAETLYGFDIEQAEPVPPANVSAEAAIEIANALLEYALGEAAENLGTG